MSVIPVKSEATPRPWLVSRDDDDCPVIVVEVGDGHFEEIVCDLFGLLATQEANAALIVECVNSHDALLAQNAELQKQLAALSKIDEQGIGHDDAMALIAHHVHEIQVLCDAFGYDPTEWLNDEAALMEANLNKQCETCRGKGYTELEGDFQFRTSEHFPRCEDCGGSGAALAGVTK